MAATPVKSAARAIAIFEQFSTQRRPLRLKEIATYNAYPQSSTLMLLKSLVATGYLNYDRTTQTYMPTFRLAELGRWLPPAIDPELGILLQDLSERAQETAFVAIQNDLSVQYLHVIEPPLDVIMSVRIGSMRPLTTSAAGWLLLSRMRKAKADSIARRINSASAPEARIDLSVLHRRLARLSRQDYCYNQNVRTTSFTIAMLLKRRVNGRQLAIGAGGLLERMERKKDKVLELMSDVVNQYGDEN